MARFSAERVERTLVDAEGIRLHLHVWSPAKPKAALLLLHGIGEYAGRYEALAQALVAVGVAVYAPDQRGHGLTGVEQWGGDLTRLGRLGKGGMRAVVRDIRLVTEQIREEHPKLPIVLLGHSWGSLSAQIALNQRSGDYAAAVLTGTAWRMPGWLNSGDLNKRHRSTGDTGYEWLSRDERVAEAFRDDPLTFPAKVLKLFGIADSLRLYGRPARHMTDIPLLIMIGEEDSLGGDRSVQRLAEDYVRRAGLSDVEVMVYGGARHEVFNEVNQQQVRDDLIEWLRQRIPALSRRGGRS